MGAKEPEEIAVDENDIMAYMDADKAFTDKAWVDYLKQRYENVKTSYEALKLHMQELEQRGLKDKIKQLYDNFRDNYKSRLWVVKQLRAAGQKVEDRHVPG